MSEKIKLLITEEQATVIKRACECYCRGKLGQFDYMLEFIGGYHLDHDRRDSIQSFIRKQFVDQAVQEGKPRDYYFPESTSGSWGIHNEKAGDGLVAYQVEKIIDNYLSVKRNNGLWGSTTNFNEPFGDDLPEIEGFIKYKDYPLKKADCKNLHKFCIKKDFKGAWTYVDQIRPKYKIPRGESSSIEWLKNHCDVSGLDSPVEISYFIRVNKPSENEY
jgi:hypothetical protein